MTEKTENLSLADARYLAISSQELEKMPVKSSKRELLKIIEHLTYVQIDTLSIVERSHHHILWTRMPEYKRRMLEELHHKDKKIFEYWGHAAAYLPMKDYRFSLVRKNNYAKKYKDWKNKNKKILKLVYERIKNEGPMQSRDFEKATDKRDGTEDKNGWWSWKPAKEALEFLFQTGELMVAQRKGFQKVYDITSRYLPANTDVTSPTSEEYSHHLIMNAVNSHGLISESEITYLRNRDTKVFKNVLNRLLEEASLIKINIDGLSEIYYSTPDKLSNLNNMNSIENLHILSPFDNLIIQRKRLKKLFNYDFQVEFYLPEPKRKYGYYSMPVLYRDKFIGRLDAKADRNNYTFIVKNFFIETKDKLSKKFNEQFQQKLNDLAFFTGCDKVEFPKQKSFKLSAMKK